MTTDPLAAATQKRESAANAYRDADNEWRDAIRAAHQAGDGISDIGRCAGITKGRAWQIINNRR